MSWGHGNERGTSEPSMAPAVSGQEGLSQGMTSKRRPELGGGVCIRREVTQDAKGNQQRVPLAGGNRSYIKDEMLELSPKA